MQCEHGKAYILISSIFKDLSFKKNKKGEMVREIFRKPVLLLTNQESKSATAKDKLMLRYHF